MATGPTPASDWEPVGNTDWETVTPAPQADSDWETVHNDPLAPYYNQPAVKNRPGVPAAPVPAELTKKYAQSYRDQMAGINPLFPEYNQPNMTAGQAGASLANNAADVASAAGPGGPAAKALSIALNHAGGPQNSGFNLGSTLGGLAASRIPGGNAGLGALRALVPAATGMAGQEVQNPGSANPVTAAIAALLGGAGGALSGKAANASGRLQKMADAAQREFDSTTDPQRMQAALDTYQKLTALAQKSAETKVNPADVAGMARHGAYAGGFYGLGSVLEKLLKFIPGGAETLATVEAARAAGKGAKVANAGSQQLINFLYKNPQFAQIIDRWADAAEKGTPSGASAKIGNLLAQQY